MRMLVIWAQSGSDQKLWCQLIQLFLFGWFPPTAHSNPPSKVQSRLCTQERLHYDFHEPLLPQKILKAIFHECVFSVFKDSLFMFVFPLSQRQHYISLFSVFLVLWHLKALQTQGQTAAAGAGWFLKIITFLKSMPFKCKATNSESMYPTISLSDSHTPRQYLPHPKSSEGQASDKKKPLLWAIACRNCSDQPVLNCSLCFVLPLYRNSSKGLFNTDTFPTILHGTQCLLSRTCDYNPLFPSPILISSYGHADSLPYSAFTSLEHWVAIKTNALILIIKNFVTNINFFLILKGILQFHMLLGVSWAFDTGSTVPGR